MSILDEFFEWLDKIEEYAKKLELLKEKDAFYLGIILGLLLGDIEIEVKEKIKKEEELNG